MIFGGKLQGAGLGGIALSAKSSVRQGVLEQKDLIPTPPEDANLFSDRCATDAGAPKTHGVASFRAAQNSNIRAAKLGLLARTNPKNLRILAKSLALEERYSALSKDELRDAFDQIRDRIGAGKEKRDDLAHVLAIAKEMAHHVVSKKHRDVQMLTAIILARGDISKMRTGEGKTLASALAAIWFAVRGEAVHCMTSNDYLAGRDWEEMEPLYSALGVSSALVPTGASETYYDDKRAAYEKDVVHGSVDAFAFDWLEDQTWWRREDRVQVSGTEVAVVDEADDGFLDIAQKPLVLSGAPEPLDPALHEQLLEGRDLVANLEPDDIFLYEEQGQPHADLEASGWRKVEERLMKKLGLQHGYEVWEEQNEEWLLHIGNSVTAEYALKRGRDYVKDGDDVVIINPATGRPNPGGRYVEGLHNAVRVKEGLEPEAELTTLAESSYQQFFGAYGTQCGLTGSVGRAKEEFRDAYGKKVTSIPTHRPIRRIEYEDVVAPNAALLDVMAISSLLDFNANGQPVIVACEDVAASNAFSQALEHPLEALAKAILTSDSLARLVVPSLAGGKELLRQIPVDSDDATRAEHLHALTELLSSDLDGSQFVAGELEAHGLPAMSLVVHATGIKHKRLNAENHEQEAEILSKAGDKRSIVVTTQMAGRGTDIKVSEDVEALGGLHVMSISHLEHERKDEQLLGRTGRQGQLGSYQCFSSPQDTVFDHLKARSRRNLAKTLEGDRIEPLQGKRRRQWRRGLEDAQTRAEGEAAYKRRINNALEGILTLRQRTVATWREGIMDEQDMPEFLSELVLDRIWNRLPEFDGNMSEVLKDMYFPIELWGDPTTSVMDVQNWLSSSFEDYLLRYADDDPQQQLRAGALFHVDGYWRAYRRDERHHMSKAMIETQFHPIADYTARAATRFNSMTQEARDAIARKVTFELTKHTFTESQS